MTLNFKPKKIGQIYLGKHRDSMIDGAILSKFAYETTSVSEYITRRYRYKSEKIYPFNRISVSCIETNPNTRHEIFDGILILSSVLDFDDYFAKTEFQRSKMQADIMRKEINAAPSSYAIPYYEICSIVDEFEEQGFQNTWLFKRKLLRKINCHVELWCTITLETFQLRMKILRKENVLFDEVVIETPPDPIHYYYNFKDVHCDDKVIFIEARNYAPCGERSFELPIDAISAQIH